MHIFQGGTDRKSYVIFTLPMKVAIKELGNSKMHFKSREETREPEQFVLVLSSPHPLPYPLPRGGGGLGGWVGGW